MRPYAGAPVSQLFRQRWLSAKMIGPAKPVGIVEVRRGSLTRSFHPYDSFGYPVFGEYPGALGHGFWYPDWVPHGDWIALDALQDIKIDQSFSNNGVSSATITLDNMKWVAKSGFASILYHISQKGYYSPLRGNVEPYRPNPGVTENIFDDELPNAQIRIRQGYGADALVTTFLGLVDDIDTNSVPNTMTITARDFGGVLVDERFFGWAKEKLVNDPVTFAPRAAAEERTLEGGGPMASGGFGIQNIIDTDSNGEWASDAFNDPNHTEWVEIHLPRGQYSNFYLKVPQNGLHVYVGMLCKGQGSFQTGVLRPTVDGHRLFAADLQVTGREVDSHDSSIDIGWYNPNGTLVPSTPDNGGWAYFMEIPASRAGKGQYYPLGGLFNVGDDTILRVGFRNLQKTSEQFPNGGHMHRAKVQRLFGNRREFTQNAITADWIIVDDLADVIRCVVRWAGFKGWEIENTGVNLRGPWVCDKNKSFMDIINAAKDMVGYTFFIGEPRDDNDDQDLGYPIFRNNRVFENHTGPTEFIDDSLLLTDAKVKISNADDRHIIRTRGMAIKDGATLWGDSIKRYMFVYVVPWAKRMAGVLKPFTMYDDLFDTLQQCQLACYLVALQISLGKYTTILTLPANPGIGIDTLQSVIDRTQGLNSRVYVTNRTQQMAFGSNGYWHMEIGGSLVDTEDTVAVLRDYEDAVDQLDQTGIPLRKRKRKRVTSYYQEGHI